MKIFFYLSIVPFLLKTQALPPPDYPTSISQRHKLQITLRNVLLQKNVSKNGIVDYKGFQKTVSSRI
jgi:hypothetical protein